MKKSTVDKDKDNKLKNLEEQVVSLTNNWKRALADYQNLVKRTEAEKKSWYELIKKEIISKFLPILDSLEEATKTFKNDGINAIIKQFKSILSQEGVKEIEAQGKVFDPKFHECIEVEEGQEENKVSHVFLKGYLLNSHILRPAKVRVIKKKVDKKEEELAKEASESGNYM